MGRLADFLMGGLSAWRAARGLGRTDGAVAGTPPSPFADAAGKKFLHVGCGPARKPHVAACFQPDDWREIRLDIDPDAAPDIVASMLDMAAVPDAAVDGVYSSHNIEHLQPHEVAVALGEFRRVLKDDGWLVLTCPDLEPVCRAVAEGRLLEPLYVSPAGPIAPLDILYGHRPALAAGNGFMAHRTGFTLPTLLAAPQAAGFAATIGAARPAAFDLWAVACPTAQPEAALRAMLERCTAA